MGIKLPLSLAFPCLVLVLILSGFGGGGGQPGIQTAANPDMITIEVLDELTRGGDDFQSMSDRLADVLKQNPTKADAYFIKSFTDFFAFLRKNVMDQDPKVGRIRDLFTRLGYSNKNEFKGKGNFWNFELLSTSPTWQLPANAPTLNEIIALVDGSLKKELENLAADLDDSKQIPATFSYLLQDISIKENDLGIFINSDIKGTYMLDYGDVQMMVVFLRFILAQIDLWQSYDWDDLHPRHFLEGSASHDPLGALVNRYKKWGTGRKPLRLQAVVKLVNDAFAAYKKAAVHIRGENATQQKTGIFTIDISKFENNAQARKDFLKEELYFRQTWMPGLLGSVAKNQGYLLNKEPGGGPADMPVTINLFRFFNDPVGVDLRGIFLKTITDPLTNRLELGVTGLNQLTKDMYTYGGVLEKVMGKSPLPGDLQTNEAFIVQYAHLMTSLPSTSARITVDGNLGEWQVGTNCALAATTPLIATGGADIGQILVARDSSNLYIAVTKDVWTRLSTSTYGYYHLHIQDQNADLEIRNSKWSGNKPYFRFYGKQPAGGWVRGQAKFTTGTGGAVEVSIPLVNFSANHLRFLEYYDIEGQQDLCLDRGLILVKIR